MRQDIRKDLGGDVLGEGEQTCQQRGRQPVERPAQQPRNPGEQGQIEFTDERKHAPGGDGSGPRNETEIVRRLRDPVVSEQAGRRRRQRTGGDRLTLRPAAPNSESQQADHDPGEGRPSIGRKRQTVGGPGEQTQQEGPE